MSGGILNRQTGYHNRRSMRLRGYDYSRPGSYFVTRCVRERNPSFFGDVVNGIVVLNKLGNCAEEHWLNIPHHFSGVRLDEYVVMPDHLHGIIVITGCAVRTEGNSLTNSISDECGVPAPTLGAVVAWFGYQSTKRMNEILSNGMRKIWQRNYYDHIIRNQRSLHKIRDYIRNNPAMWMMNDGTQHTEISMNPLFDDDIE